MNHTRHKGIFNPETIKDKSAIIIGCGNIGSHLATALVRMGFTKLFLIDGDSVEGVNLPTQNFIDQDRRKYKAEAVANNVIAINPQANVYPIVDYLTSTPNQLKDWVNEVDTTENIFAIYSGVDSIEIRHMIKEHLLQTPELAKVPVIDGRLGKEQIEVLYAKEAQEWDVYIDPEMKIETLCTEKYISYTPLIVSGLMTIYTKKIALGEVVPKITVFDCLTLTMVKE